MNDELMEWLLANQPELAKLLRIERRDAARGWKTATEAEAILAKVEKLPIEKKFEVFAGEEEFVDYVRADQLEATLKGE